ncbi:MULTISPECIES: hypothetical protein [unclassified Variovorax]|uniref:hypothetical protein n=1 Tax=unclassified Variovorax TaxID=663243 RepID=UPI00076CFF61|nr:MULTISPECIES: hypothetical protein [unclassified Variovorax]KWT89313.1 hypothetical protein APY03_3392 [Variovorax sp. WDL1]PNG56490.1 hypothetical protein CHC07_02907 [Variovorax sp. B4]PNG57913.1 hypothetical protein CHC06_02909 [Variovorax sp. B2]VTV09624.1 hypothetical protein WDL1CHR_00717 [Variovorax sp. WDL1]
MKQAHLPVHVATIAALVAIARARHASRVPKVTPPRVRRDLHRIGLLRQTLSRTDIRNAAAYLDRERELIGRLWNHGFLLMVRPEIGT